MLSRLKRSSSSLLVEAKFSTLKTDSTFRTGPIHTASTAEGQSHDSKCKQAFLIPSNQCDTHVFKHHERCESLIINGNRGNQDVLKNKGVNYLFSAVSVLFSYMNFILQEDDAATLSYRTNFYGENFFRFFLQVCKQQL